MTELTLEVCHPFGVFQQCSWKINQRLWTITKQLSSLVVNLTRKQEKANKKTPNLCLTYLIKYVYKKICCLECLPMVWETRIQSQVESYQRLKKWYKMSPCLTLNIIRYRSRVKWSNPGKGVVPSPTPWCSSYWKGSLWVIQILNILPSLILQTLYIRKNNKLVTLGL